MNDIQQDELAKLIGEVTLAWNSCHKTVFLIFWRLSTLQQAAADAVFSSLKNDSAQRDMTKALAKVQLRNNPDVYSNLNKIVNDLNNMAGIRNLAIHTMWSINAEGSAIPSPFFYSYDKKFNTGNALSKFNNLSEGLVGKNRELIEILKLINGMPPFPSIEPLRIE